MLAEASAVAQLHDFFAASAGVAGALIGLLFVAISVAPHRILGDDSETAHRIRASAALTAFTNALSVSLFALIPGVDLGITTIVVGIVGLLFVSGSLTTVAQLREVEGIALRDVSFLIGLLVVFVLQIVFGIRFAVHTRSGPASSIAILTIVSFLIGIARSWELIGATSFGVIGGVSSALRRRRRPTS